jgi:hypothetical protein
MSYFLVPQQDWRCPVSWNSELESSPLLQQSSACEQQQGNLNAELKALLGAPAHFYIVFIQITNDIAAAWMLNEIFYWTWHRKDWFKCSFPRWEKDYGVKKPTARSVVAQLSKRGLLETKKSGVPPTMHYRINLPKLYAEISKFQSSENRRLIVHKLTIDRQKTDALVQEMVQEYGPRKELLTPERKKSIHS